MVISEACTPGTVLSTLHQPPEERSAYKPRLTDQGTEALSIEVAFPRPRS